MPLLGTEVASQLRYHDLKKQEKAIKRQQKCEELNIKNQIAQKKAWRCEYCEQVTSKPPVQREITRHHKGDKCKEAQLKIARNLPIFIEEDAIYCIALFKRYFGKHHPQLNDNFFSHFC